MPPSAELIADKGYESKALREGLEARGTQAVIPPRKYRKVQNHYDKAIYKLRKVTERMFCRLKGLATHCYPIRSQSQKLDGRNPTRRHHLLVVTMRPDPGVRRVLFRLSCRTSPRRSPQT